MCEGKLFKSKDVLVQSGKDMFKLIPRRSKIVVKQL